MSAFVRRLAEADFPAWAGMRHQLWNEMSVAGHRAEIADMVHRNKVMGYGVFSSASSLIGFAEVSIRDYANGCAETPVPFLEGIWIDMLHRRQGYGRLLLGFISAELQEHGFSEICSDAEIGNHVSHEAHHHWGFVEAERVVCFRKSLR